jgi:phage shock protein PspC (stress-responsive transcriptional regulator)
VRPLQGRYLAGVCAALGRATNTDPVLWRVLLAVLTCFGGIGVLIYLVFWMITPEEGDTASPVEALVGRGRSNTSPVLVVLLGILAAVFLSFAVSRPMHVVLLAAAVLLAVALILNRRPGPVPPSGVAPPPGASPEPAPAAPAPGPQPAATPYPATPFATTPYPTPAPFPAPAPYPSVPPQPAAAAAAPAGGTATWAPPAASGTTWPAGEPGPGGYRPPFAPHGPFATAPPPPPPPLLAARPRSALGPMVFFAGLMLLGAVGAIDLTGAVNVPPAGYVAAALATVGAGLVIGAWVGRARPLIALGLVLGLALPVLGAFDSWDRRHTVGADVTWQPATLAELRDEYALSFGEGTLDLRDLDFTGREETVEVRVVAGEIRVLLPPEVDVAAEVSVNAGDATVLGVNRGGVSTATDVVTDAGSDGPGGGILNLDVHVNFGNLVVTR